MTEKNNDKITCRVLTGPTASRKTELAIRLALEKGWEIACMDSMQIYRRMNIGTAKPTPEDTKIVPHHLMDICEPDESYSVSEYRDSAEKLILAKHREGKEILFVGGTTLYLQAMMHPMGMGNVPANDALRAEMNNRAKTPEGRQALHKQLEIIDPETAARLPANDVRRVIRAIEVWKTTGVPFSKQPKRHNTYDGRFEWKVVSAQMERDFLYNRINQRVTDMIRAGLKDEVAGLLKEGVNEHTQSMSGIGYKEMIPCIYGEYSLEEAAEKIRTSTRHYAKRQITFLKKEEAIHYVRTDREGAYEEIRRLLC